MNIGDKTTENSIHIVWSPIDTSPANGGAEWVDYKVYWKKNDEKLDWALLTDTTLTQPEVETKDRTHENLGVT